MTQAAPSALAAPPPPTAVSVAVATTARPVDTTPRRVKIVILPSDAIAEIDGKRAVARGGILEVTGTLGSVHRIKLTKGKATTQVDIIMTEEGAMPPKVELLFGSAAAKASSSATPGPSAPASAAPAAIASAPAASATAAPASPAAVPAPPAAVAEPAAAPPPPAPPKIDEYE